MKNLNINRFKELQEKIKRNLDLTDDEWDEFSLLEENFNNDNSKWENLLNDSYINPEIENNIDKFTKESPEEIFSFEETRATQKIISFDKKRTFSLKDLIFDRQLVYALTTFAVVLVFGLIFFNLNRNNQLPKEKSVEIVSKKLEEPNKDTKDLRKTGENSTDKTDIKTDNTDLAVLSNYNKNPYLEDYIASNLRSTDFSVMITSPKNEDVFSTSDDIILKGQIRTRTLSENILGIKVYNNDPKTFISDMPLLKYEVAVEGDGRFHDLEKSLDYNFSKGLYYYTIENLTDDIILYVGKFSVN